MDELTPKAKLLTPIKYNAFRSILLFLYYSPNTEERAGFLNILKNYIFIRLYS